MLDIDIGVSLLNIDIIFYSADMIQGSLVGKQLEVKGFIISDRKYRPKYPAAVKQLIEWISQVSSYVNWHNTSLSRMSLLVHFYCIIFVGK